MKLKDKIQRENKVLQVIVQTYISTAMPVSSRYVSRKLDLSSATIRNIMADLEEAGLIGHPHISAGRVPTDKGYRLYVDSLMQLERLAEEQITLIESEFSTQIKSLEDVLEETAHLLSKFTNCAGMAFLPKAENRLLRRVDLIPYSRNQVLVVLVAESGAVNNYIVQLESTIEQSILGKINEFLNDKIDNITLNEIKNELVERLKLERDSSYHLVKTAYDIVKIILVNGLKERLYLDGAGQILAYPEFKDRGKLGNVVKFLEEKENLLHILAEDIDEDRLKIRIGSENKEFGDSGLSVITAGFKMKGKSGGRLGIVGPTRIDYSRIVPIVDLLSSTLTQILSY